MKILLRLVVLSLFALSGQITLAYNPTLNTTKIPYEVQEIDSNIKQQAEYLGDLAGDPHMYEFSIGAKTNLVLKVSQLNADTPIQFGLIAIKENNNNSGVTEVGRLKAKDIVWDKTRDSTLGLSLLGSQTLEAEIGPGTYRIEVSTPDNFGQYMLVVGDEEVDPGYFNTLSDIRLIQKAFGKSPFSMFVSSYVYYPIGIMVIGCLMYMTWRKRDLISKKNA